MHRLTYVFTDPTVLQDLVPAARHHVERHANNRIKADHSHLKQKLRPLRGLRLGSRDYRRTVRTGLPGIVLAPLYCWVILEVGLLIRDVALRRRSGRDRGTRALVSVTLVGAIWVSLLLRTLVPALNMSSPNGWGVAGAVVMFLGLALRLWAVVTLGQSFSTFLNVRSGQPVVRHGPYQWVRHPSYTGLWLIVLGFGLGVGHWLSLIACAMIPLAGLIPRIRLEEAQLKQVLGDEYIAYQHGTHRLVPGIW